MSDHRLQVDLDPGRSGSDLYDAGGTISGAIQLFSAESLDCRELTVTIGWQTEARPHFLKWTPATGFHSHRNLSLHRGVLHQGSQAFAFWCELPQGPKSYNGELFDIVWQVQARLVWGANNEQTAAATFHLMTP